MIDYVIHYSGNDGSSGTEIPPAGSTSDDILINNGVIYTITVEARSEYLSGESEPMIYKPGETLLPH